MSIVCSGQPGRLDLVLQLRLVVVTALPVIRTDLDAGVAGLEWTTNAYTLAFAMLLLTGAALGDRFGRRQCAALGTSAVCAHLRGVPTAEWFGLAGFRVAGTAYLKAL